MAPQQNFPSSTSAGDFVLFEDVYAGFGHPVLAQADGGVYQQHASLGGVVESSYPHYGNGGSIPDELQQAPAMSKQYYSISAAESQQILAAASAPSFETYTAFSPFQPDDVPRTLGSPLMGPAPGFLVHPPTFPYPPRNISQNGNHSTPTGSPVTSHGSGYSGSESGSVRTSPYNRPLGLETHLSEFGFDTSFAAVDPTLVAQSPELHAASVGSPYGSPSWESHRSPGLESPRLQRHPSQHSQNGRLSPGYRTHPYPPRRSSTSSNASWRSPRGSPNMQEFQEYYPNDMMSRPVRPESSNGSHAGKEGKETLCTECNKCFRDLRAHQLTHQLERPEKCPIATCEYSKKGFARKYDCQRHTLTHYKGNMVCGFCPNSGSVLEKSFNRADVFKRHLMAVHSVEQSPPNGRQRKGGSKSRSPAASSAGEFPAAEQNAFSSGKCSTCHVTFATAQQLYEHVDDCVLSKVVQEEPAAAANEANLAQVSVEEVDAALSASLRHSPVDDDNASDASDDDIDADGEPVSDDESADATYHSTPSRNPRSGSGSGSRATRSTRKTGSSGNSR